MLYGQSKWYLAPSLPGRIMVVDALALLGRGGPRRAARAAWYSGCGLTRSWLGCLVLFTCWCVLEGRWPTQ